MRKLLTKFTEKIYELSGLNKKYEDILEQISQIIINKTQYYYKRKNRRNGKSNKK